MTKSKESKMSAKNNGWGGKRKGAGRPRIATDPLVRVAQARLTANQHETFKKMGGADWLRTVLTRNLNANTATIEMTPVGPKTHFSIPLSDYSVQAGFPSPAEGYTAETLDFNDLLVDCAPATFVVRAKGESMIEAGIHEGDLLVLDRSRKPRCGDIVIMRINNEFTVKRFMQNKDGVYLHPENSSGLFQDIYPSEDDEWECVGVVTYAIKAMASSKTR